MDESFFDAETADWLQRCDKGEAPCARVPHETLLILSATGIISKGSFQLSTHFEENGFIKWKVVNRSRRLPRKPRLTLSATFDSGYAKWLGPNSEVLDENPIIDFKVQRKDPAGLVNRCHETTRAFKVVGDGEECARTAINRDSVIIPDDLESRFYCVTNKQVIRNREDAKSETRPIGEDTGANWRALIVCATSSERAAIRGVLRKKGINLAERMNGGNFFDDFSWPLNQPSWVVSLCRTVDHRGEEVASLVADLTAREKYDAVFMIGMCMGIQDRVKRFEVLVPREVFSIAHRRDTVEGEKAIPHPLQPPARSIKRMQSMLDNDGKFGFSVHVKQTICGPWKMESADSDRVLELVKFSTDVFGYEMEAEGFFRAVRDRNCDALLIKGVSDFADAFGGSSTGSRAKRKPQGVAVANALEVALAWLEHYINVPPND